MSIKLTEKEGYRFSAYCMQEAKIHLDTARQMEKIGISEVALKRERQFTAAFSVVADRINPSNWEVETLHG